MLSRPTTCSIGGTGRHVQAVHRGGSAYSSSSCRQRMDGSKNSEANRSETEICSTGSSSSSSRPRSSSQSSIDSGVTACEGTDLLQHTQQLRRLAEERISKGTQQHCSRTARRPSAELSSTPADLRTPSVFGPSSSTHPLTRVCITAAGATTSDAVFSLPDRSTTPSNSSQPTRTDGTVQGTSSSRSLTQRDHLALGRRDSSQAPDLSTAASKYRSLRRRKQAVDEAFVWIRKQLDVIEWQNQDMICLLLRNIKELRDYKQTMTSSAADTSLLHPGRPSSIISTDGNLFVRHGSVYRPRVRSMVSPKHVVMET